MLSPHIFRVPANADDQTDSYVQRLPRSSSSLGQWRASDVSIIAFYITVTIFDLGSPPGYKDVTDYLTPYSLGKRYRLTSIYLPGLRGLIRASAVISSTFSTWPWT
ncbi:uncharacterized protein ARMOST_19467 [Armillaria ostoyae]|uniref:Uncharacterized protein n=1 Tax=Armillaria ostoyae TaxID=47428 RepID=A0A284S4P0_ARMOS|nr:uncharacterized protein ARMOST_19467 [Armillaria ostoyae]